MRLEIDGALCLHVVSCHAHADVALTVRRISVVCAWLFHLVIEARKSLVCVNDGVDRHFVSPETATIPHNHVPGFYTHKRHPRAVLERDVGNVSARGAPVRHAR